MSMTLIQTVTVGSGGQASITFSSIPTTFTDLLLVTSNRITGTVFYGDALLRVNSAGVDWRSLYTINGTSIVSAAAAGFFYVSSPSGGATANTFNNTSIYISNYRSTVAKSLSMDLVMENNGTANVMQIGAGLTNSTAAINTLALEVSGQTFVQHSSASLYGITAGSSGGVVVS